MKNYIIMNNAGISPVDVVTENGLMLRDINKDVAEKGTFNIPKTRMSNAEAREYYTGKMNVNRIGEPMMIVSYKNANNITVWFPNKREHVCNKRLSQFKNGTIYSRQENAGNHFQDVLTEDGVLYRDVEKRRVEQGFFQPASTHLTNDEARKKYVGMKNTNSQGLEMVIVEYFHSDNITVLFPGSGNVLKNKTLLSFKKGSIKDWEHERRKWLGKEKLSNKNGMMKVIGVDERCQMFTIRFLDSKTIKTVSKAQFLSGSVSLKGSLVQTPLPVTGKGCNQRLKREREGQTSENRGTGELMTCLEYNGVNDITVLFPDGTVVEHKSWKRFVDGIIENPRNRNPWFGRRTSPEKLEKARTNTNRGRKSAQ